MKDYKKVDELMQKYVEATNGDVEKDFAKLDFDRYVQHSAPAAKRKMSVYVWASVAMVFIVVLTLSICLPLTLGQKTPNGPDIFYFEYEMVENTRLENLSDIKTALGDTTTLPSMQFITSMIYELTSDEIKLGCSFNLGIYDENVNELSGYILYENIELNSLLEFKTLDKSYQWDNNDIHYEYEFNYMTFSYEYKIAFNTNGFNHYYTITTASEMAIGDLMDWVF